LREADRPDLTLSDAAADFDGESAEISALPDDGDDAWLENGLPEDSGPLEKLNETYCAVFNGGKYRIMFREAYTGGMRWSACSRNDFLSRYENRRIESGDKTIPLGKAWQEWPRRKTADGTTFDTKAAPAEIVGGSLNLWTGFAIEPAEGSCELFKAMILNDLCNGNRRVFEYVLNWIAWKFQHPGELPEVAIALVGAKGTGKTTMGMTLKAIFGEHGMIARDVGQFAGRFNGHLETKCLLYGDESFWGGDRANESALKQLITDAEVSYEHKGLPLYTGRNHVGLIFAGNEKWIVPASMDERRFCVSQVSEMHVAPDNAPSDHPNRLYWNAVHRELESGGREAFLHELLHMDLGDWHPRIGVPRTAALGEQKAQGLSGVLRWYMERLEVGDLSVVPDVPVVIDGTPTDWGAEDLYGSPRAITDDYRAWLHFRNPHVVVTGRTVITELKKFGWMSGDEYRMLNKKRDRYYFIPKLSDARRIFAERLGYDPFRS
jgi:hypothetical protein